MLRSLYSGISGLRSHQTMLDVTGNNIANVNTTGFKASSTQFQDTLSQMTQGAGGAAGRDRRHQPGPGRPRRAGRRHLDQLRAGLSQSHRPGHRHDDLRRRLLRHQQGRQRDPLHPRRRLRPRRRRPAGQPRRRHPCRAGPPSTAWSTPAARVGDIALPPSTSCPRQPRPRRRGRQPAQRRRRRHRA